MKSQYIHHLVLMCLVDLSVHLALNDLADLLAQLVPVFLHYQIHHDLPQHLVSLADLMAPKDQLDLFVLGFQLVPLVPAALLHLLAV